MRHRVPLTGVVVVTLLAIVLVSIAWVRPGAEDPEPSATGTFAVDSPFNTPIPPDPDLDTSSAAMVAYATAQGVHANLSEFGIPITYADRSTPREQVTCGRRPDWGDCPLAGVWVPIPPGARPHLGSDGALVVVSREEDKVYEFWRAENRDGSWSAAWGSVSSLSGSGWSSTATGSGASRLGGVIGLAELQAGVIPHALVLQSSNTCRDRRRPPATKTDGSSTRPDCLPEGARLQLDPSIDIATRPGMTSAERAIAVALQQYGAYVADTGGARLSVSFELAPDANRRNPGSTYRSLGFAWDYADLDRIPWSGLRVLSGWDGPA